MKYLTGISEGFHDAAKTILSEDGRIVYAGHSERYSEKKTDRWLSNQMPVNRGETVFYEKPFWKNTRLFYSGQKLVSRPGFDHYIPHHKSHMAASYYTRPFDEEPVSVVIDAIGEWDTASIWFKGKKVWSMKYPVSLGLFYSAITDRIGLRANRDEYITMAIAAWGQRKHKLETRALYHRGCRDLLLSANDEDLAASAQYVLELEIHKIMKRARKYSEYLCYSGGVALNCVANTKIAPLFKDMWIFPNPGDAGSSLGAAAAVLGKRLQFDNMYLGYEIDRGFNPEAVVDYVLDHKICGIATGKAEFGPRALGNRSLIADPRYDLKDTVNTIKRRQKYRPFAPAILEEHFEEYFEGPKNEYMQFVCKARHDYTSVTHVDGSARVQVVKPNGSALRRVLEVFNERTGCPMLLNTSLNIKDKPMVNNTAHAEDFERLYNVKVF